MVHKFEKREVWKKSVVFIRSVYLMCNTLPKREERNIIDQLHRAAVSIALNIAEGSGSESDIEFKRYLFISKKSQIECIAILKIIEELYKIDVSKEIFQAEEIGKMLQGLVKYLKNKKIVC